MSKHQCFDINDYSSRFQAALLAAFGERVRFIGLQGSYLRGEATEHSDIDMVVILDALTMADMDLYRMMVEALGDADRACGFICSVADMQNWNPLEACQMKYTTQSLYGSLDELLPPWGRADEVNYIKMSLNNLYHALCHGYIHANPAQMEENLLPLYKSAFFILQNICYLEERQGEVFLLSKAELLERMHGENRTILQMLLELLGGGDVPFDRAFALLFAWCQHRMADTGR